MGLNTIRVAGRMADGNTIPLLGDEDGRLVVSSQGVGVAEYTVATTTTPYSANDNVGVAIEVTPGSVLPLEELGADVILDSVLVRDDSNQGAALQLFFFASAALPAVTDNIAIAGADYVTVDSKKIAQKNALGLGLRVSASGSLYLIVATTGTPTYGVDALKVTLGFRRG
jgi:hypothetical protein